MLQLRPFKWNVCFEMWQWDNRKRTWKKKHCMHYVFPPLDAAKSPTGVFKHLHLFLPFPIRKVHSVAAYAAYASWLSSDTAEIYCIRSIKFAHHSVGVTQIYIRSGYSTSDGQSIQIFQPEPWCLRLELTGKSSRWRPERRRLVAVVKEDMKWDGAEERRFRRGMKEGEVIGCESTPEGKSSKEKVMHSRWVAGLFLLGHRCRRNFTLNIYLH